MLPFYKRYWRTAFDIALIALTVYLTMFAFSFLYKIATPIFYAFVIYICIEPFARFLNRIGVKKSIASGISVLLFTMLILAAFFGLGYIITRQSSQLIDNLPRYQDILTEQIEKYTSELQGRIDSLPPDWTQRSADLIKGISGMLEKFGKNILTNMIGYLSSFSTFLFNFAIGIILAYFLSIEIKGWKKAANEKTPRTFKIAFLFLRDNVLKGIGAYIKAQAKMISITFIVILVSLLLLRVENAFLISLVSAIFDVLPLLGVGTLFVPWIIYLFIVGKISLAIWLSALFLTVVLTRQILEPKITGDTLGVSAFTMLSCMVISLSLFGFAGVILSPILIILVRALIDQGYFHRWIRLPQGEYDAKPEAEASSGDHANGEGDAARQTES
ncbi:sporulation integral membrane protein YtvI [Paenibacillus protaetiae]|uniref:Sporulation integral membrane protein YtvI n=1 Tax=Paenibacillus protaetiae TaxID=2509456 RepID=A0A4V0YES3_9BACL|nr:sporulation integral membrane protein YtvI [Paenibacillus protaetiae]QAY65211.1 sporulation integral membrane protein YtvI [Paenibacillus protaetiae]